MQCWMKCSRQRLKKEIPATIRRCSDLGLPPAGRVSSASRHLRDPALGAFLDGLRDALMLRLPVLRRSEIPVGAVEQA